VTSRLHRVLMTVLILLAAVLVVVNGYQLLKAIDTTPISEIKPDAQAQPEPPPDWAAPTLTSESVSETLRRPLFSAGRRPSEGPVSAPSSTEGQQAKPDVNSLTFVGTMRWGNAHKALVRVASEPFARWIIVGESIVGWKLKAIERDFIVVEHRSSEVKIPIVPNSSPPAASAQD
jgi:hypothetical protein